MDRTSNFLKFRVTWKKRFEKNCKNLREKILSIYSGAKTGVYTSLASVSAGNISEWNEVFLVNVNEVRLNMCNLSSIGHSKSSHDVTAYLKKW